MDERVGGWVDGLVNVRMMMVDGWMGRWMMDCWRCGFMMDG